MKKLTIMLLVLAMCISFSACAFDLSALKGNDRDKDSDYEKYEDILEMLEDGEYDAARAYIDELEREEVGEEAVMATEAAPLETISAPEPEDAVPATQPAGEYIRVLEEITITKVDNLGNENTSSEAYYFYNSDGLILETDAPEIQEFYGYELGTFVPHYLFEYDDNGLASKITIMYHDDVSALLTPHYDENGNLTSVDIVTNTKSLTVNFTYDANGNRLTGERFDEWYETVETFTYTYDAEGNLVQKVHVDETPWDYVITTDYIYDENGLLIETIETWDYYTFGHETWHVYTTYKYDNEGYLISAEVTTDEPESGYAHKTVNYIYGTTAVSK